MSHSNPAAKGKKPAITIRQSHALLDYLLEVVNQSWSKGLAGENLDQLVADFNDGVALMADIGWEESSGTEVELTLSADDLQRMFTRIGEPLAEKGAPCPTRNILALEACDRVLGTL